MLNVTFGRKNKELKSAVTVENVNLLAMTLQPDKSGKGSRRQSEMNSPMIPGSAARNRTGSRLTPKQAKTSIEFVKLSPRVPKKWENWEDGITETEFDTMRTDVQTRK